MQKTQAPVGANPLGGKSMPVYYEDDDTCKESSIELDGVLSSDTLAYDVFAPPGSLGIVVDKNEKGCYIHSLKKVSPMLGLMNRGDLIIALDDFDVRNMSAASLTKLMAKKSQQGERKFTLINLK
jgi:PDZ domain-containing secreted protein